MSREAVDSIKSGQSNWLMDYAILFKHKLTLFVVFSAMMSYMASISGPVNWFKFALLFIGGFCITAAANALNEVLEKHPPNAGIIDRTTCHLRHKTEKGNDRGSKP